MLYREIETLRNRLIAKRDEDIDPRTGAHSDMYILQRYQAAIQALNDLLPLNMRKDK